MEETIKRLSGLTARTTRGTSLSKVVSGYTGKVALVKVCKKWMVVPDINKLPEYVDFVWASVVFGHPGRTKDETVVCKEIDKCLSGKAYSVSKMAEVAPLIRI